MSFQSNENKDEVAYSSTWFLVEWVGSFPENAFDIINSSDVDNDCCENEENLTIGSAIMVRCGKIKSPAHILQISDNTDKLLAELRRLQRKILSEKSMNSIEKSTIVPQLKKRRFSPATNKIQLRKTYKEISTQTDENLSKLSEENRKLKAELYEANKLINSMCKDLNSIVQNSQEKLISLNNDNYSSDENNIATSQSTNKISSTERLSQQINSSRIYHNITEENDNILIGNNKTCIPRYIYNSVNWCSFTHATRKLLMAVFPRNVLATHSLTGKPSPAFMSSEMPIKMKLEAKKVADIVEIVSIKCGVSESMVRSAITTKCADENKMFKKRLEKKQKLNCE